MNEKYQAVVEKLRGNLNFSVTQNGKHWVPIQIEDPLTELPQMIAVLQSYYHGYVDGVIKNLAEKITSTSQCTTSNTENHGKYGQHLDCVLSKGE